MHYLINSLLICIQSSFSVMESTDLQPVPCVGWVKVSQLCVGVQNSPSTVTLSQFSIVKCLEWRNQLHNFVSSPVIFLLRIIVIGGQESICLNLPTLTSLTMKFTLFGLKCSIKPVHEPLVYSYINLGKVKSFVGTTHIRKQCYQTPQSFFPETLNTQILKEDSRSIHVSVHR